MKKLWILVLLLPLVGISQENEFGNFLRGGKFDTTAQYTRLPVTKLQLPPHAVDHSRSHSEFVITADSMYYSVFVAYAKDSLPIFDFDKEELVFTSRCSQCLVLCPTARPCHRNACRYSHTWFVRPKQKPNSRFLIPHS